MSVDGIYGLPPAKSAPGATSGTPSVDYQSFLRLLVAQMKNQDPTAPMDSTDYVAQLATFSQVEQSVQINAKLDQLRQSSLLAQAGSMIGRTATSADGLVTGKVTEVRLISDGLVARLDSGDELFIGEGVKIT